MPLEDYSMFRTLWSVIKPPKIIKAKKGILRFDLINDLIKQIGFPYSGSSVIIDLTNINGVNAIGLLGFTLILIELLRHGVSILVYTPNDQQFNDFINLDDIKRLEKIAFSDGSPKNSRIIWRSSQEIVHAPYYKSIIKVVPLQNEKDTDIFLAFIKEKLINILHFDYVVASEFCQVVSELFDNIDQHSDSEIKGFGSFELQQNLNPPRVIIAIGDLGKGIKKSFKDANIKIQGDNDCSAIKKAVKEGVSSKKEDNQGRGGGLTKCRKHADSNGCIFAIRTGSGYYIYKPEKDEMPSEDSIDVPWFRGTQAYFGLLGKDT